MRQVCTSQSWRGARAVQECRWPRGEAGLAPTWLSPLYERGQGLPGVVAAERKRLASRLAPATGGQPAFSIESAKVINPHGREHWIAEYLEQR